MYIIKKKHYPKKSVIIFSMSSTIILKVINNKRLLELLIKKKFNVGDKDIKFEDDRIVFKTNYKIGQIKIKEKLEEVEGDFEFIKVSWTKLNCREEEELNGLLKKRKFNSE